MPRREILLHSANASPYAGLPQHMKNIKLASSPEDCLLGRNSRSCHNPKTGTNRKGREAVEFAAECFAHLFHAQYVREKKAQKLIGKETL